MEITTTIATEIRTASAFAGGNVIASSGDVGDYEPIVDHLMKQKFQLHNKNRQKFTTDINRTAPLKPFTMFTSNKQEGLSLFSTGYSWNPTQDKYSVELWEYDKNTAITLVEES